MDAVRNFVEYVYVNPLERLVSLIRQYPTTTFGTIIPLPSWWFVYLGISSNSAVVGFVIIMASLLLFFHCLTLLWMYVTNHHHHHPNKSKSTDGTTSVTTTTSVPTATAFSTFVQSRLHQSRERARVQQQTFMKLLERKLRDPSSSSWWEDFSPSPFRLLLPEEEDEFFFNDMDVNGVIQTKTKNCDNTNSTTNQTNTTGKNKNTNGVTHFCFLVHGHRGHSRDLSYVQAVMRRSALGCDLVVHSTTCNEKKTDDGVVAGGERLLLEMISVIREHMSEKYYCHAGNMVRKVITISMLGNSLGGLYARYAIAKLKDYCHESCTNADAYKNDSANVVVMDDAYTVYFNIFCTTATPHLGVAGHTYLPLPRTAEIGFAHAMGQSGKDLFRLNSLLWEMATQECFLEPLASFRKRIAYANAYGSDFPVPAATAAFLSESSLYPHHVVETSAFLEFVEQETKKIDNNNNNNSHASRQVDDSNLSDAKSNMLCAIEADRLVVATMHTRSKLECAESRKYFESTNYDTTKECCSDNEKTHDGESDERMLAQMSTSLDSLGWKKVFVDMRAAFPKIPIPKSIPRVLRRSNGGGGSSSTVGGLLNSSNMSSDTNKDTRKINAGGDEKEESMDTSNDEKMLTSVESSPIHHLKQKGVLSSKEVAASVLTAALPDDQLTFHWPMGHNMMVAFSRSKWSAELYKAGRPFVDALAKELVADIFTFEIPTSLDTTHMKVTKSKVL